MLKASIMMMHSVLLSLCSKRVAAWPISTFRQRQPVRHNLPTPSHQGFRVGRCLSSGKLLTDERVRAVMEGSPRASADALSTDKALSTLSKTKIRGMKKDDLRMELSFRGMDTKGTRNVLVTRLLGALDDNDSAQPIGDGSSLDLDPTNAYALRVKGRTTPDSRGAGLGLILYNPEDNQELWSGRIYVAGDRSPFEAEYSAIILGMSYTYSILGVRKLILQISNDAIVNQINGTFRTNKNSLKDMMKIAKELEDQLDEFSVMEIAAGENVEAEALANKALATRISLNVNEDEIKDPIEELDRKESHFNQADDPAQSATIDPSKVYLLRFDGGSRGNPGIAGAGMVIYDEEGQEIWSGWKFHNEPATNNFAEYLGCLCGVKCAESLGIRRLVVEGDSQLIVRQLNGEYRCKEEKLKKFYDVVVNLAEGFESFEIRHIPRAENKRADWLANHAMDLQESHGFNEI